MRIKKDSGVRSEIRNAARTFGKVIECTLCGDEQTINRAILSLPEGKAWCSSECYVLTKGMEAPESAAEERLVHLVLGAGQQYDWSDK